MSVVFNNAGFLAKGLLVTIELSLLSCALSLVFGVLVGLPRAFAPRAIQMIIGIYVDVMRSLPLLVVLLYAYFAVPILLGRTLSAFVAAVAGITVWWTAGVAEAVRGAVLSVSPGQRSAGLALGMRPTQVTRRIILPQALIRTLPVIGSTFVMIFLNSALASAIAVPELLTQSQVVSTETYRPFPVLTAVMIVYFLVAFPVARATDSLYNRLKARGIG